MTFKEEFKDFLEKNKISQNKAASEAGYTGSVISQWLTGSYKGDVLSVEANLKSWLDREKNRRKRRNIGIVETTTMRRIMNSIQIAHEERDIALIVGPAGVGKTTALRVYHERNPASSLIIEVDDSMSKTEVIKALAEALGMHQHMTHPERVRTVVKTLAEKDLVVIVDEADYLSDGALELLRRVVFDKGKSGLVLVGLQRLAVNIKHMRNNHQQLASRVGVFLEVAALSPADAEAIVKSVWADLPKEATGAFVKGSFGSARTLAKLIDRAHRTALINDLAAPDTNAVRLAGELILH